MTSGVTIGPYDPFDGVWLALTVTEPATCRITARSAAVAAGLCTPAIPSRSPAFVEGDSLAYFTSRRLHNPARQAELGATGHGPHGRQLADRLCRTIRTWDQDRAAQPAIVAVPHRGSVRAPERAVVVVKHRTRLLLTLHQ